MKPAIATWLLLLAVSALAADADLEPADHDDEDGDDFGDDYKWKIVFYTGDRTWAGTDSQIYFQVIGDKSVSPIQLIPSSRANFEVNSVDSFAIRNINLSKVGAIKSIVVGKQHSLAFFNDWQLIRVELYDNTKEQAMRKYVFNCNCWLTTTKFKQIIPLEFVGIHQPIQPGSPKGSKLFPLMVGLLLLLLILTMVSYFTNVVCKRWRESQDANSDRDVATSFTETRLRRHRRNNPGAGSTLAAPPGTMSGDRIARPVDIYKDTRHLPDSAGLDKPPEYFELYPASSTTKINTTESIATAMEDSAANQVTETTPIMQAPAEVVQINELSAPAIDSGATGGHAPNRKTSV